MTTTDDPLVSTDWLAAHLGDPKVKVIDALSDYDVKHIDMPLTPERVWRAIQDAKGKAA